MDSGSKRVLTSLENIARPQRRKIENDGNAFIAIKKQDWDRFKSTETVNRFHDNGVVVEEWSGKCTQLLL